MAISPFSGDTKEWEKLIKQLKEKFDFKPKFPLHAELEPVLEYYRLLNNNFVDARATERKALFSELSNRLKTLSGQFESVREILKKLGFQEKADISFVSKYLTQRGDDLPLQADDLAIQLYIWERAARKALRYLNGKKKSGGRPTDRSKYLLIRELHAIYQAGTGRNETVTKDAYRGYQYGGRFFNFVNECSKAVGISCTNASLGKSIERALNY
jgi:hypothetical protein